MTLFMSFKASQMHSSFWSKEPRRAWEIGLIGQRLGLLETQSITLVLR